MKKSRFKFEKDSYWQMQGNTLPVTEVIIMMLVGTSNVTKPTNINK